jgi:hypothetical protein
MSQASDYLEQAIGDAIFNNQSLQVAVPYFALFTAAPSDAGGGTEVSGGSYARTGAAGSFPAASGTGGAITNNADITFAQSSASWGSVTHVGIFDAATGGNLLVHASLSSAVSVGSGDIFKLPSGGFTLTVS